ncbi:hypothetical protein Prum_068210 [Phytohabitans rumicis]|uniref:Peptidase inhibitor family I36 n=2 Tax=Phytohabitans rumicis TaxID=1076125 RepID=A0A6V8LEZ1_9ACTN|nr:hypothetical protein Prum_068210 [Phytohabitans rumicis]
MIGGMVQPVAAAPKVDGRPGMATFQGRVIDLAKGWQGAQTCLVYSAADTRCFATHAEADAVLGYTRERDPLYQAAQGSAGSVVVLAVPVCSSGWLCLYADTNGNGRRLQFRDEYWQYLSNWDFDRQTSSWRNNQGSSDAGHLSMYNLSTVYNCGANSYANSLGIYNDQAYAVWG